jgi:phage-related protein
MHGMKPLRFVDSSQKDLREMPADVRHTLGIELMTVQYGGEPSDFKPVPDVDARERMRFATGTLTARSG